MPFYGKDDCFDAKIIANDDSKEDCFNTKMISNDDYQYKDVCFNTKAEKEEILFFDVEIQLHVWCWLPKALNNINEFP